MCRIFELFIETGQGLTPIQAAHSQVFVYGFGVFDQIKVGCYGKIVIEFFCKIQKLEKIVFFRRMRIVIDGRVKN